MSETYVGPVSIEGSEDTMYFELTIDDVDSGGWIGTGRPESEVPEVTAVGVYSVKLVGVAHPRRGQKATAAIDVEAEDGVLRLQGRTAFA
jgi:hypothetical protein